MNNNVTLDILLDTPSIFAASTRRGSSISPDDSYSGFSVCDYTGDDAPHYSKCRQILAESLGLTPEQVVMPRQTHSCNVAVVTDPTKSIDDTDGVVTSVRGIAIGINTADCVPIVLADEQAGIIGAAHAGWRGALGGIAMLTAAKMIELGARPENITVAIGACIGKCCFEVGEEVATLFPAEYVIHTAGSKPHVDLPGYVISTLEAVGITTDRIASAAGCTRCQPDVYFSARASGIKSGRNFTFIMLKSTKAS